MIANGFIKAYGIHYAGALSKIRKSADQLQPIYEAFTNSLEAIRLLDHPTDNGSIILKLCFRRNPLLPEDKPQDFEAIQVEDSGVGFNDKEFERLINLNDTRKGFFNKGSGRVQFLHYFERSEYTSIFKEDNSYTGYKLRKFTISKGEAYLRHNSIIRHERVEDFEAIRPYTVLTFKTPLKDADLNFYKVLSIAELKENIINRYLAFFCENRDSLPKIILQKVMDDQIVEELDIKSNNIPKEDNQRDIEIKYCKVSTDGKSIERTAKTETLNLKGFKINKAKLQKNGLKLTSKGEIAKEIKLDSLLVDDEIDGHRYLFLLSGDYINNRDTDTRGILNIPTLEEYKKKVGDTSALFTDEEIVLDDIREEANAAILNMYEEIGVRTEEKKQEVEELRNMFLLNPDSIREAKIKLTDTEEEILEKVYKADAKMVAKGDAAIKKRFDALANLNPSSVDFSDKFLEEVNELTRTIPLQNRTELTHYVARRKLVLNLFEKVLNRKLVVQQKNKSNHDEGLIHNLLFRKGSEKPENSDLWIINEDFIYFSGTSEKQLSKLKIGGELVFKKKFSDEEEDYLKSLGENRKIKRPDVLLFPDEGKCIIIEFKSPEVNASDHLTQIDFYANLIRNYTEEKFLIQSFYGYLIGENIEPRDVLGRVSRYEHSYQLDYLFRPSEKVNGFDGRKDGSIYTEVIKYSTLLERAKRRNNIFIQKL